MKYKLIILLVVVIALLVGCSFKSEEKVIEEVNEIAKTTFVDDDVPSNTDLDEFSFYLPTQFEVIEETNNNLVLQNSDQLFILFYNPFEDTTSRVNYEDALEEQDESYLLLESFEDDHRFGYIKVKSSSEEDGYELQIGVGGVKITTIATKENLEDSTVEMMKMANSIAY